LNLRPLGYEPPEPCLADRTSSHTCHPAARVAAALSDTAWRALPPRLQLAQMRRYGDGHLLEVIDAALGIEIIWTPILYTPDFTVTIEIFRPRA
jgi:hypothetical protein